MVSVIERLMEERGKYSPISSKLMEVPCVVVYNLLKKAIKIVENTEEYTEYLLLNTFDDKNKYTKIPPGTVRVYQKNLVSFYNGRTWRKLK